MDKTASKSFSISNSFQKSPFFAVLMYSIYGHPRYFKFKRKYQQYDPCFHTIFPFLMTMPRVSIILDDFLFYFISSNYKLLHLYLWKISSNIKWISLYLKVYDLKQCKLYRFTESETNLTQHLQKCSLK